jgi:hypothetical protein
MTEYIPLNRTFSEFYKPSGQPTSEIEEDISWAITRTSPGRSWSELLKDRAIVVLGEAGTGKTREFEEQARRLQSEGKACFFVRLESLAQESLREVLSPGDQRRLDRWLGGDGEGYFFLDSVDEAKLQSPRAFETALRHLQHGLLQHLQRAHVITSCRVSDWLPIADHAAFHGALALPRATVVQLNPLNDAQRQQLIHARGVEDAAALVDAIRSAQATHLAERPQDVLWLVEHWIQTRRLGSLTQLIEANVAQKLRELSPGHDRTSLTDERARQGAMALAFAATLCRRPALLLPGVDHAGRPGVLDPRQFLRDWRGTEIRDLLTRPLFDESTYGRVRFHHRETREYLAAQWLILRLRELPRRVLEGLFIQEVYGERVMVQSMRGVASWVLPHATELRRKILEVAPELFWSSGDPEKLPLLEREQALHQLVKLHQSGRLFGERHFRGRHAMLARFAAPSLTPALRSLIQNGTDGEFMDELFLEMAQAGGLTDCAAAILGKALDASASERVRAAAIRALRSCGSSNHTEALLQAIREERTVPDSLRESIIDAFFPHQLGIPATLQLVLAARGLSPNHYDSFRNLIEQHLAERCVETDLPSLLEQLLALHAEQREELFWVLPAMAASAARIIKTFPGHSLPEQLLIRTLFILYDGSKPRDREGLYEPLTSVQAALKSNPSNRSSLLRACSRHSLNQAVELFSRLEDAGASHKPEEQDWLELLRQARGAGDVALLREATDAVLHAWESRQRPDSLVRTLEAEGDIDLATEFARRQLPSPRATSEEATKSRAEEWRDVYASERLRFEARIAEISAGRDLESLSGLYQIARHLPVKRNAGERSLTDDLQVLPGVLGPEIGAAARQGFSRLWRNSPEHCLSAGSAADSYIWSAAWDMAVSELGIKTPEDVTKLGSTEAERLAFWSMARHDALPDWFPSLVQAYPEEVRRAFTSGIEAEMRAGRRRRERPNSFLRFLEVPSGALEQLCLPALLAALERHDSVTEDNARRALALLLEDASSYRARLAALAARRTRSQVRSDDDGLLALWLAAWLRVEAGPAWEHTEGLLLAEPEHAPALLAQLGARLERDWGRTLQPSGVEEDYVRPALLARMSRAYWAHLAGRTGPWAANQYWGDLHERALRFWDYLPGRLSKISGELAHKTLVSLAEEASSEERRKYLRHHIELHRSLDAGVGRFDPEDTRTFMRDHSAPGQTADALFEGLLRRLDELKQGLEQGDFSGNIFIKGVKEEKLQLWLAQHLVSRLESPYSVTRESQLKEGKKPDILVQLGGLGQVPIELKPLDKARYSYSELEHILCSQVLQYLHDPKTTHGVLLLINLERRDRRVPGKSEPPAFEQVVEELDGLARKLVASGKLIRPVLVIGIDLTASG